MDNQDIATTSTPSSTAPAPLLAASSPPPQDSPAAPAPEKQYVFALFHHVKYDSGFEDHPGRLTECWAIFSSHEKAVAGLRDLVRRFPPDNFNDVNNVNNVEAFLENCEEMIEDQYGNDKGRGYRYRTDEVCEEIMWVQGFEVK